MLHLHTKVEDEAGQTQTVQKVIDAGAVIDVTDDEGETLVHLPVARWKQQLSECPGSSTGVGTGSR